MRAYLQYMGVRKAARLKMEAALRVAFPDLRISETPGCDIPAGGIASVRCELAELPLGHVPFVGPTGEMIEPGENALPIFKTAAKDAVSRIHDVLSRSADRGKVHMVYVFESDKPENFSSSAWGPAVDWAPRPKEEEAAVA